MNLKKLLLTCIAVAVASVYAQKPVLKIAYSDWPGWTAWEIADKKGFFKKHDANVKLEWFDYGPSMDAFAAKQVDAVGVANGDAMMMNATGARNSIILINDYRMVMIRLSVLRESTLLRISRARKSVSKSDAFLTRF